MCLWLALTQVVSRWQYTGRRWFLHHIWCGDHRWYSWLDGFLLMSVYYCFLWLGHSDPFSYYFIGLGKCVCWASVCRFSQPKWATHDPWMQNKIHKIILKILSTKLSIFFIFPFRQHVFLRFRSQRAINLKNTLASQLWRFHEWHGKFLTVIVKINQCLC